MQKLRAGNEDMHLFSCGSGDPILFLHGIPTSCQLWNGVVERMAGKYHCIAVDLPGLGQTAKRDHRFGELKHLVEAIESLRKKRGIEKWHVVGHDAGCAIAVHYAHHYQERVSRMVLMTPSIFPELEPFFLFEILRKPVLGEVMAPVINTIFWKLVMRRAFEHTPELDAAVRNFHAPFSGLTGSWRLMSLLRWGNPAQVLASVPSLLPELLVPTLIMHGSKDPAVPVSFAQRAAQLLPNAEKVLLDCGHFLPMSEPGLISEKLLHFFDCGKIPSSSEEPIAAVAS
ncbi:pimeloyl-ACP methyl ester carboxylesterase [Silvibacterium bohemicum]|uniref:Pimeloyl-ACP methyl ester carboxylesterase n=1 Tax=Silvibacterium bohemicum TaxID=1577686 RepID=A0A841K328_9BACT|nr:alpha/beta hydrolase [Silvibacterium bohemicum]MBB6146977.1 pimeloyl-ACP methyl ester carboxylesterase [Silvibacterium bohemicum]